MKTQDFDYDLPEQLIAQAPADRREHSRLMVLHRSDGTIEHDRFSNLGTYLHAGDILVANRSKVIPARLHALKDSGGRVELLLLRPLAENSWLALARPSRRLSPGMRLKVMKADIQCVLEQRLDDGQWLVTFTGYGNIEAQLREAGSIPLPPYIRTLDGNVDRYQTVYADREGSVAAPTAGLHFSSGLLDAIQSQGVAIQFVTLHVGVGTFRPVVSELVENHTLHAEWGDVPQDTAQAINASRASGGRTIAVGTTSTRLLESAYSDGEVRPFRGDTNRFIYPGYRFQTIDALVTNFHLPRSSLLMLVSAFAGRDMILEAYRKAIEAKYRFFSFGDAMLIL
ncbi:MAG: tRNA preQ1(34) S-adenosylmethionine ribosyltransferase-isomerase QueA [Chloroflexota bacterium]